MDNFADIRIN